MKNSKEYGIRIDKFIKSVKSGQKIKPADFADPLESLIFGLIAEHQSEKQTRKFFKSLQTHFLDLNDLRVSRIEEIQEVLEDDSPQSEQTAENLTRMLSHVFDKYDVLSLKGIGQEGKRQARKELEELTGATRFAVNFCFLASFEGHAIPLNPVMKEFLRDQELVDAEATDEEIEGFLERHISASSGWEFYELLRQASEGGIKKPAKARVAAKNEKKKTETKKKNKS